MKKSLNNIIHALKKDGQLINLTSGKEIKIYPRKKIAIKMINDGWFSDWIEDEKDFLKEF